jgi:hypothetical protein
MSRFVVWYYLTMNKPYFRFLSNCQYVILICTLVIFIPLFDVDLFFKTFDTRYLSIWFFTSILILFAVVIFNRKTYTSYINQEKTSRSFTISSVFMTLSLIATVSSFGMVLASLPEWRLFQGGNYLFLAAIILFPSAFVTYVLASIFSLIGRLRIKKQESPS